MPHNTHSARVPKLCRHKVKGKPDRGYVTLNSTRRYLGRWGTPETKRAYELLVAEFLTYGHALPCKSATSESASASLTVAELLASFWRHAESHYRKPDGTPTSRISAIKSAVRPLRRLYGHTRVDDFGPRSLKVVRSAMVEAGHIRRSINQAVSTIRGVFRWGVENEMVNPTVYHALQAVRGLDAGRTDAPEGRKVLPVPEADIEAVKPHLPRQLTAMIHLQLATGARPGEVAAMRAVDLDTSGSVWTCTPPTHKNQWRGRDRHIYIGPRAQRIIAPFMAGRAIDKPLFSPIVAEEERRERMHEARVTPEGYGNAPGTNRKSDPQWSPGESYTTNTYARAVRRACRAAGVPVWSPNRLRHNAATAIRREHGLEAAQLVLGHSSATLTDAVYAERDEAKVRGVVAMVG